MSLHRFFLLTSAFASALFIPPSASGATWRGAAGASWFVASNWNPTGIPTAATNIVISTNRSAVVSSTGALGAAVSLGSSSATGTLTVQGGGKGTSGNFSLTNGLFKITGAGSQWTVNGYMAVQRDPNSSTGSAEVLVSDGGKLIRNSGASSNDYYDYGAKLTVTGMGSTVSVNDYLSLYTGTFNFLDHASVTTGEVDLAYFDDNIATVNISGGAQWTLPGLAVGNTFITSATGYAALNLADGGSLVATGSNGGGVYVGKFGRVNVGTGGLAGDIDAPDITLVHAASTLSFNHTDNVTLDAPILGIGTVIKEGTGVTTLSGTSAHTGTNLVKGGILHVAGSIDTSSTTVELNGTLSGNGNVGTVDLDGTLAPGASFTTGSAGVMTIGSGSFLDGVVKLEIGGLSRGADYDALNVSGAGLLTFGGNLELSFFNGFVPVPGDSFDLFNGTFAGNFNQVLLPSLAGSLSWNTSELSTTGVISIVPEPGTGTLLLAGVVFPLARRRRK